MTDQSDAMHALFEHWGWSLPRSDSRWQTVRCGIHDDRNASARVNMALGAFICLACGVHAGSPFGLAKAVENLGNAQTFEFLRRLGVDSGSSERVDSGPKRPWKGRRQRSGAVNGWRRSHA